MQFLVFVQHLNDENNWSSATSRHIQLVNLAESEMPKGDKMAMKESVKINKQLALFSSGMLIAPRIETRY